MILPLAVAWFGCGQPTTSVVNPAPPQRLPEPPTAAARTVAAPSIPERIDEEVVVSPDGKTWAALLHDRITIRDVSTGLEVASAREIRPSARIALLDGRRVVVADFEGVRIAGGPELKQTQLRLDIAAGPNGQLALVDKTSIEIIDVARPDRVIARAARSGGHLHASPVWHGKTLVIFDGKVEVWRVDGDKLSRTSQQDGGSFAVSWNGERIATAHKSGAIRVTDPDGKTVLEMKSDHARTLGFVGETLYVQSGAHYLKRWHNGQLVEASKLPIETEHWAETPTGLLAGANGLLVETPTGYELAGTIDPGAPIAALAWSRAGDQLAIAANHDITLLERSGVRATKGQWFHVSTLAYRGTTHELWWGEPEGRTMKWDATASTGEHHLADAGEPQPVGKSPLLALSSDGALYLVQPGLDRDLELRNATTSAIAQRLHIPSRFSPQTPLHVKAATFVDGDKRIAITGEGATALWNVPLKVLAWRVDQDLLAASASTVASGSTNVHGWDLATERSIGTLDVMATATAFSPDGRMLAVGTHGGAIQLVDVETWNVTTSIAAHETAVSQLAWRPDGKVFATGSVGGVIKVWSADAKPIVTIAIGRNTLPNGSMIRLPNQPAPGSVEPDAWLALFAEGTTLGNGNRFLRGASKRAPSTAWATLFP